jgi:hypothetical protein
MSGTSSNSGRSMISGGSSSQTGRSTQVQPSPSSAPMSPVTASPSCQSSEYSTVTVSRPPSPSAMVRGERSVGKRVEPRSSVSANRRSQRARTSAGAHGPERVIGTVERAKANHPRW